MDKIKIEELLLYIADILNQIKEIIEGVQQISAEDRAILESIKERWLTQKEAAEILGKCSASIKKMRDNGKIRGSLQGGRTYKYKLSEVLRVKNRMN
ncbi:MAG TPA: helix-turn-helix domain-containing protein [Candidatus Coprenecus pullistercoris]|nr:helix-turn-helix domain-containing protein [Candidatus Coprenecus pullistercoris]